MKYLRLFVLSSSVFLSMLLYSAVQAGCTWEWVCDADGECHQEPICDSTLDIQPPAPPGIPPIVAPEIKPIDPIVIPPIGTSECHQERLCDMYGNCRWEVVCK